MSVHTADQGPAYRPDPAIHVVARSGSVARSTVTAGRWLLVSMLVAALVAIATVAAVTAWGTAGWIVLFGAAAGVGAIALILAEHLWPGRPGSLPGGAALLARPRGRHRAAGSFATVLAVVGLLVVISIVAAALLTGGAS